VMVFFVTFYNDKCFERYQKLYPACCDFMENAQRLVQEMNVSLPWKDLHYHRIAVTKYLMAAVHEYFMIVCGGKLQPKAWDELVKKGLLTKEECRLLEQFPGGESTFVLTSWVLFILRDALVQDCMWRQRPGMPKDWQPQQTVHIFNRHCSYVVELQRHCHRIGYMMANPIPFAYYHLCNVILVFNIFLLATFSALYQSYASVFPFGVALLVYMGLREISTSLADPFGKDSVDFPVPDFLRYSFDNTVSLLLSHMRPDVRENVLERVENVEDFSERNLRRFCDPGLFAEGDDPTKGVATTTEWDEKGTFESAHEGFDLVKKFKYAFSTKEFHDDRPVEVKSKNPFKERKTKAVASNAEEKKLHKLLEAQLAEMEGEYNGVVSNLDKLIDRYPQLEDALPTVVIPEAMYFEDHHSSSASSATDEVVIAIEDKH